LDVEGFVLKSNNKSGVNAVLSRRKYNWALRIFLRQSFDKCSSSTQEDVRGIGRIATL
jgi:hypothetical protein